MAKGSKSKNIFKNMLKYIAIIAGLFLIVVVAGLAYLFLVSGSELFGIIRVTNRATDNYNLGEYNINNLNTIEISTNRYDVQVMASSADSYVTSFVKNDISGLVKKKNSKTEFSYYYNGPTKSLKISLKEIDGWVSVGESRVLVVVPDFLWTQDLNIKISAKKSACAIVSGIETTEASEKSVLNLLEIKNNHGNINFDNLKINQLKINTNSAGIYAGENVSGKMLYAEISMKNGTLDFTGAGNAVEVLSKEGASVDEVDFIINKLRINKIGKKGKIKALRVEELSSGEGVELTGGSCSIKNLSLFSIKSKNFDLNIGVLNGGLTSSTSVFRASGDGKFSLTGNSYSAMNIVTNEGSINIAECYEAVSVESASGNIIIKNAHHEVGVINISGDTNISFHEETPEYNELSKYRCITSARIKSGKFVASGINKINLTVDAGGKPKIELRFNKVIGANLINAGAGSLLVVTPDSGPYELNLYPTNVKADIDIGTVTLKEKKTSENFFRYVFCESGQNDGNLLEVHAGGTVKMYSESIYLAKKK